ncbi:hypothetical protein SAMD00019534_054400 [Acytostelium subglobosum LB1]|uniref:hypothetical protein n=1 Tax=Acytostelium subglobosum LB1 TaxID=1410327 RepID=UPI000644909D|nr:hypothetical protein SAMD00019534_054400 [Acytostelium subglobosum LB1]GAM22265.1 hypothetical protein SAMD00019534_054400 [Acytostelium subglobosum LB1]|eukprot:XP_012754385.1 hypothetical protein SAMD00019534_054400 [Acytostelium subglobosum LB1]
MFFISIILGFIIVYLLHLNNNRVKNGPPTPPHLPLIGNLHMIDKGKPYESLHKLYLQYGKIYSIYMGSIYTVVLNDSKLIHEAFTTQSEVFKDRYLGPSLLIVGDEKDLSFSNGELWKKLRTLFGMTLTRTKLMKFETIILDQVSKLIAAIKRDIAKGQPIQLKKYTHTYTLNCMFQFTFSAEITYDSEQRNDEEKEIMYLAEELTKLMVQGNPSDFIHILKPFFNHHEIEKVVSGILSFSRRRIVEHQKTLDRNNPRDFVDLFLIEMENDPEHTYTIEHIERNCLDLMVAGTDTAATTVEWAVLMMINRPEIQELLYQEIVEKSPSNKPVSWSNKTQLPLFYSAIKEGFRLKPTSPLLLPHQTVEDTTLAGYFIPKGTQVIANVYTSCISEQQWKDPLTFNPSRFIGDDKSPASFGDGPRKCVGMQMGEMMVYDALGNLYRELQFERTTKALVDESPHPGLLYEAPNYDLLARPRTKPPPHQ